MLTDAHVPGWTIRLRLEGQSHELQGVTVGSNMIGVKIPSTDSEKTVEFLYCPPSFNLGATISVTFLICMIAGLAMTAFPRPSSRTSSESKSVDCSPPEEE